MIKKYSNSQLNLKNPNIKNRVILTTYKNIILYNIGFLYIKSQVLSQ